MSSSRSPNQRKMTRSEEIEHLHPIERTLLSIFEFLASIKLAVVLLFIFMVELIIGTLLESSFNARVSKYFIYSSFQFKVLLSCLGLNVLCAAMIRFPWKRYQTGFVITHAGLIIMIFAFFITSAGYLDCQMSASQEQIVNRILDTNQDVITISEVAIRPDGSEGEESDSLTKEVDFGPFTWGSKTLWGNAYWRNGENTDSFSFSKDNSSYSVELDHPENSDRIVVKQFLANSERARKIQAEKNDRFKPGIEFILDSTDRGRLTRQYVIPENIGFRQDTEFENAFGTEIAICEAPNRFALNHVLSLNPIEDCGPKGTVVISYMTPTGEQHIRRKTEELLNTPIQLEGSDYWFQVSDYFDHADLQASEQGNPVFIQDEQSELFEGLNIQVATKQEDLAQAMKFPIFGDRSSRNVFFQTLSQAQVAIFKDLIVNFITESSKSSIQIYITPDGDAVYRYVRGKEKPVLTQLEIAKAYPCFFGFQLIPIQIEGKASYAEVSIPKPLPRGTTDGVEKAIEVEYRSGDTIKSVWVAHNYPASTIQFPEQNKLVKIRYGNKSIELPFSIRLDAFVQPVNPGTMQAAEYKSFVTLFPEEDSDQTINQHQIYMNHPLSYQEDNGRTFKFYQSTINFVETNTGQIRAISGYTVAYDPGLDEMYVGATTLSVGIFLMFYMGGYFRKRDRDPGLKSSKANQGAKTTEDHLESIDEQDQKMESSKASTATVNSQ